MDIRSQPEGTKLDVFRFGAALFDTNDLDPLYVMIHAASLPRDKTAEYVLAYLCFYDTGTSSWVVDSPDFFAALTEAADTSTHPRGGDRRHFRGDAARRSVADLRGRGKTARELLTWLAFDGVPTSLGEVMDRVQSLVGFGPTIAFKAADMLERFGFARIWFSPTDPGLMSETPKRGAKSVAEEEGYSGPDVVSYAHRAVLEHLKDRAVPPRYERTTSVLETETVLCKYQHYLNGSYYVGKGKVGQREGLRRYPGSPTAERMRRAGVEAGLWEN